MVNDGFTEILVADVGGTHARFAVATLASGQVVALDHVTRVTTSLFPTLAKAWRAFVDAIGRPLPTQASLSVAAQVGPEAFKLTNGEWLIRPHHIADELGVERVELINDFAAVAHAVSQLDEFSFEHVCGEQKPLPTNGIVSIVGPGTGLGVAQLHRCGEDYRVIQTEAGHIDFAPVDEFADALVAQLRPVDKRVSAERIVSGRGLALSYDALVPVRNDEPSFESDQALWTAALSGTCHRAVAALELYCRAFGSITGNIALAQRADAVVIAGGLGWRLREQLAQSGFAQRFSAKGHLTASMKLLPVKILTHPEPGLFGAAAAFAKLPRDPAAE